MQHAKSKLEALIHKGKQAFVANYVEINFILYVILKQVIIKLVKL